MTLLSRHYLLLFLLLLPTSYLFIRNGLSISSFAMSQDVMEGEEDADIAVEMEDGMSMDEDLSIQEGHRSEESETSITDQEDSGEEAVEEIKSSPDVDTVVLFIKPPGDGSELPSGHLVVLLMGFTNKGYGEFIVEDVEASFRYPQDYSYYLQNFTKVAVNRLVPSKHQATFQYQFVAGETFSAHSFGLTVIISYKDQQGNPFQSAVFNKTIRVLEPDEGLDGETFFLYVFLVALTVLLIVGAQQFFSSLSKKKASKPRQKVELGTQNADIDYDWIPKEAIKEMNQSPRGASRQSPQRRRSKRPSGIADE